MNKLLSLLILLAVTSFFLGGCFRTDIHAESSGVFRFSDRQTTTFDQMMDDLIKADIIFIGETHDRKAHHRLQLAIIKALQAKEIPLAVGFEMFVDENQKYLDDWSAGKLPAGEFIRIYYSNWNFPWPLYEDIFLNIRESGTPAIALNVHPDIARKVSSAGFASLSEEELAKLPPDTGCAVDEQYMKFIKRAHAMHGHGGKEFIHFCEAQLLRDQVMARHILEYLKKNQGRTVVVITGNGHAWKRGIPEQITRISDKVVLRVLLPYIPGHLDPSLMSSQDADYLLSE
jgi:uncharacterized iron-regulated protein